MRWLVGWSSAAAGISRTARSAANGSGEGPVHPVGSQLLWGGPDPLWAVGDWRPDEIRVVQTESPALPFHKDRERPVTRIAVLGCCGASDDELRAGLVAARGGALR
ncbi:asparagine synthase, partial [Streptomyces sp. NPDC048845]